MRPTLRDRALRRYVSTLKKYMGGAVLFGMSAGGGTNWEAALAQAETDAKSAGDGDTYIIFVSDGDPTFRMPSGQIQL